ncbi:MAG: 2-hydroxyacid dehydrogenase [Spirochaetota bacterium]
MPHRIAFFDAKPYDRQFFDAANQGEFEIKYFSTRLNADSVSLAQGFDAVCAFVNDNLSAEVINKLKEMEVGIVALRSAGYNHVDLEAAYQNVHMVRVPAYSPYSVAEHAAAMMLSLNRKTHRAYYRTRDNNFSINGFLGFDMNGKTAGIVGTGRIGLTLVGILRGFGMKVIAYDARPKPDAEEQYGFTYVSLDELYEHSDIISLHCPLTPETHHIINADSIKKMKREVMIINTSRGQLVDTGALLNALREQRIGSAGLDVYEEEDDYFFEDLSNETIEDDKLARLLTFPNVLVTSHQAFFTKEALTNIAQTTLANLRAYFNGEPLDNEICYRCNQPECRKEHGGRCF